jgi:hypothetical protein
MYPYRLSRHTYLNQMIRHNCKMTIRHMKSFLYEGNSRNLVQYKEFLSHYLSIYFTCVECSKMSLVVPLQWTLNFTNGLHISMMTPWYPLVTLEEATPAVVNQIMENAFVSGTTKTELKCPIIFSPPLNLNASLWSLESNWENYISLFDRVQMQVIIYFVEAYKI